MTKTERKNLKSATFNPNCIEYIPAPAEFEPLVKRARELVKQIAGDDTKQALVLETADHQVHEGILDMPYDEDETLLNTIGKDNAVVRMVCCRADGRVDLPPADFCAKLCHFNSDNKDAEMLLYVVKPTPIRFYMPKV